VSLEPIPETRDALLDVSRWSEQDLTAELIRQGQLVEEIVPPVVGLSLAPLRDGLTFTLAATQERLKVLDAVQYAVGGPCVDAALAGRPTLSGDTSEGLLDEQRWAEFARVGAAQGVLSTLSFPIHERARVVGGVNLYAATADAFHGKEDRIAATLGAWAPGAVHNADLTFSTRAAARRAPQRLDDLSILDQAAGVVMAANAVDEAAARRLIADSAHRGGQDPLEVARALIRPYQPAPEDW
jgi:GAF domain-containing protein